MNKVALTVFQDRAGDRNNLGMRGAQSIGRMLAGRLDLPQRLIGNPQPVLDGDWRPQLAAAMPALRALAHQLEAAFQGGHVPLTASNRCAASLATLPVVARHRPDACVVWFDAHADLNTPDTTSSGYLGGMALSGPAGMWDSGLGAGLALSNIVLLGQRSVDPSEQALFDSGAVRMLPPRPRQDLAARLRAAIGGRPVYFHLDCDVLEPGIVPTEYVHAGGLSLADLHAVSAVMAESEVIGVEIAEFQDAWQENGEAVSPAQLLSALAPVLHKLAQGG